MALIGIASPTRGGGRPRCGGGRGGGGRRRGRRTGPGGRRRAGASGRSGHLGDLHAVGPAQRSMKAGAEAPDTSASAANGREARSACVLARRRPPVRARRGSATRTASWSGRRVCRSKRPAARAPGGPDGLRHGPPGPRARRPAPRRGRAAPGAPDRGRGRRPRRPGRCAGARPRCRRPPGWPGHRRPTPPVTSTTGSPTRASSSSRTRATPARTFRNRMPAQARHSGGRSVAQRRQRKRRPSGWSTEAPQAGRRPAPQAARPAGGTARAVQDAQDPGIGAQQAHQRVRVEAGPAGVLGPAVHHVHDAANQPVRRCGRGVHRSEPHSASSDGHGEVSRQGTPARGSPLQGHVAGVPGGGLLLLVGFVVLVDDDDRRGRSATGAQAAAQACRRPSAPARPRAPVRGCRATVRPARCRRSGQGRWPRPPSGTGRPRCRGAAAASTTSTRSAAGGRRSTARSSARAPAHEVGHVGPIGERGGRRGDGGDDPLGGGRLEEGGGATGPAPGGPGFPARSDRPSGPRPLALGEGAQGHPWRRHHVEADDPAADPAAVELDADDVSDAHLVPDSVRDQVVEGLVDGRHVREDPDHQRRRGLSHDSLPVRPKPGGFADPSGCTGGDRSEATLGAGVLQTEGGLQVGDAEVISHVKSASLRPKWP